MTDESAAPGLDDAVSEALVRSRRFFTRARVSDDLRTLTKVGGRQADDFYRDRWSHDKVVRSTHGVNCTGSCSWKVYVKDGIITWETQQTDYPSVGPDSPEYEPRGCPRGAAFSWYTYSPTRVRYPYVRGVLLQMFREAKEQHDGDPVRAWEHIVENPLRARAYKSARGKGGLVRAGWEEAAEIVAAAHIHTIKKYGPDRVAGFSPIPAMSMVSHASGARFVNLVGGSMLSFYDWYADLPVASPQVFGDQTDVPESGDWWNAGYLIMWGSNLPVTRTPDAHWMTEARYRGQKVVAVAPDYADNVKFADEWLPAKPGTDAALAMAMGHVVLKEFFVDRATPYFTEYVKTYTDLPLPGAPRGGGRRRLHRREVPDGGRPARAREPRRTPPSGPCFSTPAPGTPSSRTARWATATARKASATGTSSSETSTRRSPCSTAPTESVLVRMPRFDTPDGAAADLPRGVPVRRVGGHLVTTVFDLLLAQYGVGRSLGGQSLPGEWAAGYDDAHSPYTPAWQEAITGVPAATAARIGREFAANAEESRGRSMIVMGAGTNHWFHSDTIYRAFLTLTNLTGCQGVNGGGWAHYVGQEKVRPITGYTQIANALDWSRPPRNMIQTAFWYLHTDQFRYDRFGADTLSATTGAGQLAGKSTADVIAQSARMGWMPSYPTFDRNPLDLCDDAAAAGKPVAEYVVEQLESGALDFAGEDPDAPGQLPTHPVDLAGQPAGLLRQGQRVLPEAPAGHGLVGPGDGVAGGPATRRRALAGRGARGEARPADDHRLPPDEHDGLLRRRAAGRDLVREARPQHHRHASVRALVQPGHRPALADAHRLGRLADDRREVQRARRHAPRRPHGRRGGPAHARHPGRDGEPARRRPRLEEGGVPSRSRASPCRGWSRSSATTARSLRR